MAFNLISIKSFALHLVMIASSFTINNRNLLCHRNVSLSQKGDIFA